MLASGGAVGGGQLANNKTKTAQVFFDLKRVGRVPFLEPALFIDERAEAGSLSSLRWPELRF